MLVPTAQAAQAVVVPPECEAGLDLTGFNVIIGTNASETLVGTEGPDFICGKLGDGRIFRPGDDFLDGDIAPDDDGQAIPDPTPNKRRVYRRSRHRHCSVVPGLAGRRRLTAH